MKSISTAIIITAMILTTGYIAGKILDYYIELQHIETQRMGYIE